MDLISMIFDNHVVLKEILHKLQIQEISKISQNVNSTWRKLSHIVLQEKSVTFTSFSSFIIFIQRRRNFDFQSEVEQLTIQDGIHFPNTLSHRDFPLVINWLRLNGHRLRSLTLTNIKGSMDNGCTSEQWNNLGQIIRYLSNLEEFGMFGELATQRSTKAEFIRQSPKELNFPTVFNSVNKLTLGVKAMELFLESFGDAFSSVLLQLFPSIEEWSFESSPEVTELEPTNHDLSLSVYSKMMRVDYLPHFANLRTVHFQWDENRSFSVGLYHFFFAAPQLTEKIENLIITEFKTNVHLSLLCFILRKMRQSLKTLRMEVKGNEEFRLNFSEPMKKMERLQIQHESNDGRIVRLKLDSVKEPFCIKYLEGELVKVIVPYD